MAPRPKRGFRFLRTRKHIFETVASIRIGCWKRSNSWLPGAPSVHFRSAGLSAAWTGRLEGPSHVGDHVEFESRVNDVWARHDGAVICVYDLKKFGGDVGIALA